LYTYDILTASDKDTYCLLGKEPPELSKKGWRISKGQPMEHRYPEEVLLEMDEEYPGIVAPDLIRNTLHFTLVSKKLKELFEQEAQAQIEFLPFSILNHKGREAEGSFYIANVLDRQACMDLERSEYRESKLRPGTVKRLFQLHLDHARIDAEAKLFRLHLMPAVIIIRSDLRATLEAADIEGLRYLAEGEKCFIN
jgi:hypothetical protein